jgi:hypothetical protein
MDSTDITVMTDVNHTRKIPGNMDVADRIHKKKQTSRTSQSSWTRRIKQTFRWKIKDVNLSSNTLHRIEANGKSFVQKMFTNRPRVRIMKEKHTKELMTLSLYDAWWKKYFGREAENTNVGADIPELPNFAECCLRPQATDTFRLREHPTSEFHKPSSCLCVTVLGK